MMTHAHADHLHGIDDLRPVNRLMKAAIPLYADAKTLAEIRRRFGYAFRAAARARPILQADARSRTRSAGRSRCAGCRSCRSRRTTGSARPGLSHRRHGVFDRCHRTRRGRLRRDRRHRAVDRRLHAPRAAPDAQPSRQDARLDRAGAPAARGADAYGPEPRLPRRSPPNCPRASSPAKTGSSSTSRILKPGAGREPETSAFIFHNIYYATFLCSSNIEMTPLCKVEVTLPWVLGSWGMRRGGGVDEQTGVHRLEVLLRVKQPYAIGLKSGRLMARAGLWETWRSPAGERTGASRRRRHRTISAPGFAPGCLWCPSPRYDRSGRRRAGRRCRM